MYIEVTPAGKRVAKVGRVLLKGLLVATPIVLVVMLIINGVEWVAHAIHSAGRSSPPPYVESSPPRAPVSTPPPARITQPQPEVTISTSTQTITAMENAPNRVLAPRQDTSNWSRKVVIPEGSYLLFTADQADRLAVRLDGNAMVWTKSPEGMWYPERSDMPLESLCASEIEFQTPADGDAWVSYRIVSDAPLHGWSVRHASPPKRSPVIVTEARELAPTGPAEVVAERREARSSFDASGSVEAIVDSNAPPANGPKSIASTPSSENHQNAPVQHAPAPPQNRTPPPTESKQREENKHEAISHETPGRKPPVKSEDIHPRARPTQPPAQVSPHETKRPPSNSAPQPSQNQPKRPVDPKKKTTDKQP